MHRVDRTRKARLSHNRKPLRLRLAQCRICGNDHERRALVGRTLDYGPKRPFGKACWPAALAEFAAAFEQRCPKPGAISDCDASDGVDRRQRADDVARGCCLRRGTYPTLADDGGCARARAEASQRKIDVGRCRGRVAELAIRWITAPILIAATQKI